jgi:pilus assembly protein CpaE
MFPYVIVDLDRNFSTEQLSAIVHADILLIVMQLDLISLCNTSRVLDHLDHLGIAPERIRVIVNRFHQRKELPLQRAKQALGVEIMHCLPDDPADMNWAVNSGVPVTIHHPRAKISRSLGKLAQQLEAAFERIERAGPEHACRPTGAHRQVPIKPVGVTT